MASAKLDDWWKSYYASQSMKNPESLPIFSKFLAITRPYQLSFEEIEEKYVISESQQYLQ